EAEARADLRIAGPQPGGNVDAIPVPDLIGANVANQLIQVVDLPGLVRVDVEHSAVCIASAARQPRIHRRRHAELRVVAWRGQDVVGDAEVAEDAAEVRDVHRHTRHDLLLDAGRELPVVPAV